MDASGQPSADEWRRRSNWFENAFEAKRRGEHGVIGEHAQALLVELETVFCAGAWIASVILAASIIDAHLREVEVEAGQYSNTRDVFEAAGLSDEFHWLRQQRNRYLHFSARPYLTVDMHWFQQEEFEAEARRAIELLAQALFRIAKS